jgi:hypothetical protein
MPSTSASLLHCFCGLTYSNEIDLEEHRRARGHFPSHSCSRFCKHPALTEELLCEKQCGFCGKACEREDIMEDHLIATGHCYCSECNLVLKSQAALESHRQKVMHASEFRCCDCNIPFKDIHALNAHMASRAHRKPLQTAPTKSNSQKRTTIKDEFHCKDCKRTFMTTDSLRQHQNSVKHHPISDLSCPFDKGCRAKFAAPSALIQHLESGMCRSGIGREKIRRLIEAYDPDHLVHKAPELENSTSSTSPMLASSVSLDSDFIHLSEDCSEWSLIGSEAMSDYGPFDDGISIEIPTISRFRCSLCPEQRKHFATVQALEQHMQSPAHCTKIYHCPVNLVSDQLIRQNKNQRGQKKYFSTLGGLAQHVESGACVGGSPAFKKIVDFIERRLEQLGFTPLSLLLPRT